MTVRAGTQVISAEVPEHAPDAPDLRALLRNELSGLEAGQRAESLEFILRATADELREPGGLTLGQGLHRVRDALREQLPRPRVTEDRQCAAHVDVIYAVDHESFWIKGWAHDDDRVLDSLLAVSPEGARGDLLADAYRHSRIDIEEAFGTGDRVAKDRHGFVKFLRLNSPSRLPWGSRPRCPLSSVPSRPSGGACSATSP